MIEESRTNLVEYGDFTTGWTEYGGTATSTTETTAPDGTFTAKKITSKGDQSTSGIYDSIQYSSNTTYTHTMWLKAGNVTIAGITVNSGGKWASSNFPYITVNLSTGAVTASGGVSAKATAYPNGWYRLEATGTFGGNTQVDAIWVHSQTGSSMVGNTTGYYYVWGPQAEQGNFGTSYIPTTGSTVTRAVDTAIIKGTNFTDFYNAPESTIFFESGVPPTNNSKFFTLHGDDGGGIELIEGASVSGPGATIFTYANSTTYANISVTDSGATTIKYAAGIKANNINLSVNGTLGTADTSSTQPDALDKLIIGNYISGNYYLNTTIKKLSYYNKRLPNAQLQGLTQ